MRRVVFYQPWLKSVRFLHVFSHRWSYISNSRKIPNFILQNIDKQMVPCKSTAKDVSFEWSHHWISSTYSKVRITLRVSILVSGSERVKYASGPGCSKDG